jgi:hypothetical protein
VVVEGWIEGWCTVHIIYLPPTLGNSRLPETDGRKFGLSAQLCLCSSIFRVFPGVRGVIKVS